MCVASKLFLYGKLKLIYSFRKFICQEQKLVTAHIFLQQISSFFGSHPSFYLYSCGSGKYQYVFIGCAGERSIWQFNISFLYKKSSFPLGNVKGVCKSSEDSSVNAVLTLHLLGKQESFHGWPLYIEILIKNSWFSKSFKKKDN